MMPSRFASSSPRSELVSFINHHFCGLDDRFDNIAPFESELLRRGAADERHNLDIPDCHDNLGHHVAELDGLDGPLELVPCAQHGILLFSWSQCQSLF